MSFRWDRFAAYLFDIDGTLLNSRDGVHYNAFHSALREVFATEERIDNVAVHGNTDVGILRAVTERAGIGEEEFRRKLPSAIAHLEQHANADRSAMRPEICLGIADLLQALKRRGALLGVVSGNFEPIGWAKLEAAGLRGYFSFGAFCQQDCASRAEIFRAGAAQARALLEGPDRDICVVGDTPADIAAARAASLPVIAVATGIYNQQQLQREQPDLCLGCCAELFSPATGAHG